MFLRVAIIVSIIGIGCAQNFKTRFQPERRTSFFNSYSGNFRTTNDGNNVICYYESMSHYREGQAKFEVANIEPALRHCTHLIYGYAGIHEDSYKLVPLNEQYDVIQDNYRKVTDLKERYPKLKVLLSVGGNSDVGGEGSDRNLKYRTLLESSSNRLAFINSAYTLIKGFGFDGLDLAWEFPETKPKKIRGTLGSIWHSLKKKVGGSSVIDENAEEHRQQFTSFVREMKNAFRAENLQLSLSVLPNVNSTVYYDPKALTPNLDFINLLAYDFHTAERNPKEADYPAPLYDLIDRKHDENVDAQVVYWLNNGAPANKLILGIATYGRSWKMDDESDINGMPPLHIDGPGEPGLHTKQEGLLSYPEICLMLKDVQGIKGGSSASTSAVHFKRVADSSKRKGTFAFRLQDENNNGGIWVGYEDPDSVANKAAYAKAKGLGGVAINDLTLDDFRAVCGRENYPLLVAAVSRL